MTEAEWSASDDPAAMLRFCTDEHANPGAPYWPVGSRKLRLFACACARLCWHLLQDDAPCGRCGGEGSLPGGPGGQVVGLEPRRKCRRCAGSGRVNGSRRAVEIAERFADGLATEEERQEAAYHALQAGGTHAPIVAWACVGDTPAGAAEHAVNILDRHAAQADLLREIIGNPFRRYAWSAIHDARPSRHELQFLDERWLTPFVRGFARGIYEDRNWEGLPILADALEEEGCAIADLLGHLRSAGPHARGCWVLDLILDRN